MAYGLCRDRSNHQANDQSENGGNRDGHGDTPSDQEQHNSDSSRQIILRLGLSHGFTT
jgi:hypothetical protein